MFSSLTPEQKSAITQKYKAQKEAGRKADVCESRTPSSASSVSLSSFNYPGDSRAAVSLTQNLYVGLGPSGAKLEGMYSSAAETSVSQAQRPENMDDIIKGVSAFQQAYASNLAVVAKNKSRPASKGTAEDCLDGCKPQAENVSDTLAGLAARIKEMEARNQELQAENKELKRAAETKGEAIESYRVALEDTRQKYSDILDNVMKSWIAARNDDTVESRQEFINSVPTLLGVKITSSPVTGTTTTTAGDVKKLEAAVSALKIDNDGAASVVPPVLPVAAGSGGGGGVVTTSAAGS
jgi:hypothetical protein